MNHLGGKWFCMGYVEWFTGVYRGFTLVDGHPGRKGPMFLQVKIASSAATWYNGSSLTK